MGPQVALGTLADVANRTSINSEHPRLRFEPMDRWVAFAAGRPRHCNLETWNPQGWRKDSQGVELRILARDTAGNRHHEIGSRDNGRASEKVRQGHRYSTFALQPLEWRVDDAGNTTLRRNQHMAFRQEVSKRGFSWQPWVVLPRDADKILVEQRFQAAYGAQRPTVTNGEIIVPVGQTFQKMILKRQDFHCQAGRVTPKLFEQR